MKKLSPAIARQVRQMLPDARKETENELAKWGGHVPDSEFYSDDRVIEIIPFAAYEYVTITKGIRVDRLTIIEWLNAGLFDRHTMNRMLAHALRKLALGKKSK